MTDVRSLLFGFALGALALASGCEPDYTPYHELEGFRVLAVRAEKPALREGESSALEALVFLEDGDPRALRFAWSWCPLRLPSSAGGECALSEAQVAMLLGVPSVSFDLGTEASPELVYPGSAEAVRAACENQAAAEIAVLLDCEGGLPISVRADVTFGGKTIRVHKEVRLMFEAEAPNVNPSLGAVSFRLADSKDALLPWTEADAARLMLGKEYELAVEVPASAAESFVPRATEVEPNPEPRRESLFITWFTTTGSVLKARTWFLDGSIEFAELGDNEWSLPKAGDEEQGSARLILVLRDERGGVDWLERQVELGR